MNLAETLDTIAAAGNLRSIPREDSGRQLIDFSTNDYLGLGADTGAQRRFLAECAGADGPLPLLTASASRLLASVQSPYARLEALLTDLYGDRPALLFNSGWHANTGIIAALASLPGTTVIADRLAHASAIDGMALSRAPMERFRHNDLAHLERLMERHRHATTILLVVESVYSMDGDRADIAALAALKRRYPQTVIYVDEAHALGTDGPAGLGLSMASGCIDSIDIVMGTFGKALASQGAFCSVADPRMRDFLVNRARPLIFSTALAPLSALWTIEMLHRSAGMDTERERLRALGQRLQQGLAPLCQERFRPEASHIQPFVTGSPESAVALSQRLLEKGLKVLPIRVPTVPPGTDRLRISLSATTSEAAVDLLTETLRKESSACRAH